jgi:hypothetical protein
MMGRRSRRAFPRRRRNVRINGFTAIAFRIVGIILGQRYEDGGLQAVLLGRLQPKCGDPHQDLHGEDPKDRAVAPSEGGYGGAALGQQDLDGENRDDRTVSAQTAPWTNPQIRAPGSRITACRLATRTLTGCTMRYVGLDAHWRQSTICVLDHRGQKLLSRTIRGSAD